MLWLRSGAAVLAQVTLSLGSAFSLAGYDSEEGSSKEERVGLALRVADPELRRRLLEELVNLLRSEGYFRHAQSESLVDRLKLALGRKGIGLGSDGYLEWPTSGDSAVSPPDSAATPSAPQPVPGSPAGFPSVIEHHVPSLDFLETVLRRLPNASRPFAPAPPTTVRNGFQR